MNWRRGIAVGLMVLGISGLLAAGSVRGGEHILTHNQGQPKPGRGTPHTHRLAGYPQCVSRLSMPSYNEHYSGDYVGGGKPMGGYGRCLNEGTWGWDYTPFRPMSERIFMGWSHGRHDQGGTRGYATDGPKPLEHLTESVHEHFSHE